MKLITNPRNSCKEFRKVLHIMRITLLLLLFVTYGWANEATYAQVTEIHLSSGNKTLQEVFSEIEGKTEFIFFYNDNAIDLSKKVHVEKSHGSINEILDNLLEGSGADYKIVDRQVIFYKKKQDPEVRLLQAVVEKKQITGLVLDEHKLPVIGANVVEKGTTNGTVTDLDGKFTLAVQDNAVLLVSYIGYITQEIPVKGNRQLNITLQEDSKSLDEVVVVGYGTQKKVNLTGSVDVITEEVLANRSAPTMSQLIQGASPNLNISMNSLGGEPGAARTWNIRGTGSLAGNQSPLVLVDGVETNIDTVDPESIESISVLKDASASAIYGSRAPFGVILVTTKRGKKNQEMHIQYNNNLSFASPLNIPHFVDALTWVTAYNQIQANSGLAPIYPDAQVQRVKDYMAGTYTPEYNLESPPASIWRGRWEGNANYDWPSMYYKKSAFSQKHNINIEGGGEKTQYYVSAGYLDQGGLYKWGDDKYQRYNVMANISSEIKKWLRFDFSSKYSRSEIDRPLGIVGQSQGYILRSFLSFGPLMPMYNEDGTISNPLVRALQSNGRERKENHDLGLTLRGEIEPIAGWKTSISYNYNYGGSSNIQNPKPVQVQNPNGSIGNIGAPESGSVEQLAYSYYTLANGITSYEKTWKDHYFKVLFGYERETSYFRGLYGSKMQLITEEVPSINTALGNVTLSDEITHWATEGYFGRVNYNYKEKYLFEFSARYNGSSRFAKNSRWGFFPSVSVGYNISKEDFWNPVEPYMNSLKLRASYGSLGNQNVANYLYLSTVPVNRDLPHIIGNSLPIYATVPGIVPNDLTWETVTTLNIGADMGFLNNRLGVVFDWYNRVTSDMFGPAESVPAVLGTSIPYSNNAKLSTKGFELTVSWRDHITSDLSYNVAFSLGDSRSTILKYKNDSGRIDDWYEGKKVGEIWGFVTDGIIQSEGEPMPDQSKYYNTWGPGDMKYKDLDGNNILDDGARTLNDHGDLKVIGNHTPRFNYGITAGLTWKDFDFNMFWQGIGKRDYLANVSLNRFYGVVIGGTPGSESALFSNSPALDYWRPADEQSALGPNTDAYFPKPYFTYELEKNRLPQSRYVLNASYLRLKNLQLGYTVPKHISRKLFLLRIRIYVSGENLLTITKLPDSLEPETTVASDPTLGGGNKENAGAIYPISRNYSFGINLTF